jgi:hypothetical protein
MHNLESGFFWQDGWVDYPFFQYRLQRKAPDLQGYVISRTGQIRQPLRFYGSEFQDIELPIDIEVAGIPFSIMGSFWLPDSGGRFTETIPLASPVHGGKIVLLTTFLGQGKMPERRLIAELKVDGLNQRYHIPIRIGEETESWDETCQDTVSCETVYKWRKRIAFVGQRKYPGAWQDFWAGLHGVSLELPHPTEISRISLRYLAENGELYVWGVGVK